MTGQSEPDPFIGLANQGEQPYEGEIFEGTVVDVSQQRVGRLVFMEVELDLQSSRGPTRVHRANTGPVDAGAVSSSITDPEFKALWDAYHHIVPGEVVE